MSQIKVLGLVA